MYKSLVRLITMC